MACDQSPWSVNSHSSSRCEKTAGFCLRLSGGQSWSLVLNGLSCFLLVLPSSELFKRMLGIMPPELGSCLFSKGTFETLCSGTTQSYHIYIESSKDIRDLEVWWGASGYIYVRIYVPMYAHACMYVNKCMYSYNCIRWKLALGGLQSSVIVHFSKTLLCLSDSHILRVL